MTKLHNILILPLVFLVVGVTQAARPLPPLPNQAGLANLFFNSRITRSDPRTLVACFSGYVSTLKALGEIYANEYNICLDNVKTLRQKTEIDFLPYKKEVDSAAKRVIDNLTGCSSRNDTLDSFRCHASLDNNTILTYNIAGNASEYATLLQERYRSINVEHEQCSNAAERRHVQDSADNYEHLQLCLQGLVAPKPPVELTTTSTSTTTTTTTTTTTEPPTTTTTTTEPTPITEGIDLENQFRQILNLLN